MKMCDLLACRICLATDDVKLYNIYVYNLVDLYTNFTGIELQRNAAGIDYKYAVMMEKLCVFLVVFVTITQKTSYQDGLPHYICHYCRMLLLKSLEFRAKCCEAQNLLELASNQQLTTSIIKSIKHKNQCTPPYSISHQQSFIEIEYIEPEIKEEPIEIKAEKEEKRKKKKIKEDIKIEDDFFNDIDETFENENDFTEDTDLKNVEVVILSREEQLTEIEERKTSSNYLHSFYKCDLCYRGFLMASTLKNHMAKHDPERGEYECEVCKCRWPSRRALRTHIVNTHERKFVCKLCDHVDRSSFRAKEHSKWHNGFMFNCKKCDAVFSHCSRSKSTSYLTHVRLRHPSTHACDICGESFIGEFGLRIHKKKGHKLTTITKSQCLICETKFFSEEALTKHLEAFENNTCDGNFGSCKYCGENFENGDLLKDHLKANHEDESLHCEECSRTFRNERSFAVHTQRVHLGVRRTTKTPYPRKVHQSTVCEICGYTCISKVTLLYHQRIHTGEKPFQCSLCPKKFSVKQRLQIHMRTHTGESPYKCQHCPKAFKHKAALNRHDLVHSGIKPYSCAHCGKSFSQSNSMKLHINSVHLKMPAPYRRRSKINP